MAVESQILPFRLKKSSLYFEFIFLFLVNHKNISIYYLVKDRNYSRICQSRFNRYGCQLI